MWALTWDTGSIAQIIYIDYKQITSPSYKMTNTVIILQQYYPTYFKRVLENMLI